MKMVFATLLASSLAVFVTPGRVAQPQEAGQEMIVAGNKQVEFWGHDYEGVVTAKTDRSISIKGEGYSHKGMKTRLFVLSSQIAFGHIQPNDVLAYFTTTHLIGDVKTGDKLSCHITRVNGVDYCVGISILRRPGGRVPPAQNEAGFIVKHSELMNAYQDLEEKGIPLPEKFRPQSVPLLFILLKGR